MNTIKRLAAAALTTAAVLAPVAPALADTPYAQASIVIGRDGSPVGDSKNVVHAWQVREGLYCVILGHEVDLEGPVAVHATPVGLWGDPRWLSVTVKSPWCHAGLHGVSVRSLDTEGHPSDASFVLTVS
ncbi:hypothetical protein OIE67_17705 [Nonomuraea fuscirosea]|jgi:hypothetical protein|uniref:hypothetical protein n=1 Tax=Nonomuraea fuscirosea TaxID=1291556 RepID=UPI002DDA2D50|nr:hypothetical protein [Nonomuraea fuscirosea]WSA56372.1 hypothetical protein OIE67_17705 [Nonomuraea fuscirosea]